MLVVDVMIDELKTQLLRIKSITTPLGGLLGTLHSSPQSSCTLFNLLDLSKKLLESVTSARRPVVVRKDRNAVRLMYYTSSFVPSPIPFFAQTVFRPKTRYQHSNWSKDVDVA